MEDERGTANDDPAGEPTKLTRYEQPAPSTLQRLRFAQHYVLTNCNAIEAARRAGFKGSNWNLKRYAEKLLRGADVLEFVAQNIRAIMSSHEVAARLSVLGRADIGNYLTVDELGRPQVDLNKVEAQANTVAIQEIKFDHKGGWQLKVRDPLPALELLFRASGQQVVSEEEEQRRRVDALLAALPPELATSLRAQIAQHEAEQQGQDADDDDLDWAPGSALPVAYDDEAPR